jgi:release factor glutamine methyltransferase
MEEWTIQRLLNWVTEYLDEKGLDSARLSAELLLSHVLGLKRIELYTHFNRVVEQRLLDQLHELVKRAGQHEPVAYLVGKTEFYSLELEVTADCMIPRPETELLVQRAVEFLRTRPGRQLVCDLCTGCGCIAVAIARNFGDCEIVATDISATALTVAVRNTARYQVADRIRLLQGDLFEPLVPYLDAERFDVIVCNPPYVSAGEYEMLDRNVKSYEPKLALFGGDDGLDAYRRIGERVEQFLKPDGALMLEVGYSQGPAVKGLLEQTGAFKQIEIEKDYNKIERLVIAGRSGEQKVGSLWRDSKQTT